MSSFLSNTVGFQALNVTTVPAIAYLLTIVSITNYEINFGGTSSDLINFGVSYTDGLMYSTDYYGLLKGYSIGVNETFSCSNRLIISTYSAGTRLNTASYNCTEEGNFSYSF